MDEGLIYEDGPPEQIFEHPLREKTRAFIHRIRSLSIPVSSADYDLYAIQGALQTFGEKHMLSPRVNAFVALVAEEVLLLQKKFDQAQLQLSYSEKDGTVNMVFENAGEPDNPLETKDGDDNLGLMLIVGRCEAVDHSYENGRNVLRMKIKNG